MPDVTLRIPEHLETHINQLVEDGEFDDRREAIENLLATGVTAHKTSGQVDDDETALEDDGMMGHDEEYVF